jgi:hypothetical protein
MKTIYNCILSLTFFFPQLLSLMKSLHLSVENHKYLCLILALLILVACYRYIVLVVLVQYNYIYQWIFNIIYKWEEPSWPWSYGSWIYNYLCIQCLSPLMMWVRISIRARCTTLCDNVCWWLAIGWWFPPPIKLTATMQLKYCWQWR